MEKFRQFKRQVHLENRKNMSKIRVSDDVVEYQANSLQDLQVIFRQFKPVEGVGGWLYRGHADESWPLVPKVGRPEFGSKGNSDWAMFSLWKDKAIAYESLQTMILNV